MLDIIVLTLLFFSSPVFSLLQLFVRTKSIVGAAGVVLCMLNLFHYNLPPSDRTLLLIDENLRFLEIQQKSSSTAHPLLTPHTPPSSHSVHRTQRSKQPIYNWYVSPGAYFTGLALVVGSRYYVLLAWYYSRYPISPSISPSPSLLSLPLSHSPC